MAMKDWVEKLNLFYNLMVKKYYTMPVKYLLVLHKSQQIKNMINLKKQDKLYKSDFDNFLNEARMIENGSDK